MNSDGKLEITPQHVAGQRVLRVIRDRANLVNQYADYDRFEKDPVLGACAFVKFMAPPMVLPDGTQTPPIQRFINPTEAKGLIAQDLIKNSHMLRSEYDAYVSRRGEPQVLQPQPEVVDAEFVPPASQVDDVQFPPIPIEVTAVEVSDATSQPVVEPQSQPENPGM